MTSFCLSVCICTCVCVSVCCNVLYCTTEAALQFPGKLSPNIPKLTMSESGEKKPRICEKCGTSIV